MTLPPVQRQPLRESFGGAESPLEIAMRREQEAKLARKRNRGAVLEAILAEGPATLQKAVITSPEVAQQWTSALEQPIQRAVTKAFHDQPLRMAAVVAPALSDVVKMETRRAHRQWSLGVGRLLSGLTHTRVWRWVLEALWEGESVVEYIEQRAGSWEVVELFLHDPAGSRMLCTVAKPGIESMFSLQREELLEGGSQDGRHYSFVGSRCRLTGRVIGAATPQAKQSLQALCLAVDQLLEDTNLDPQERARLLPLRLRAGLISDGPLTLQHAGKRTISTLSVIALMTMSVLIWAGNQEYRWQCFLDLLSREPGIQVTHHERGWGRSRVQGIRSSDSRDPAALATSLGLDAYALGLNFKISSFPAGALNHNAEMRPLGENQISAAPLAGAEAKP